MSETVSQKRWLSGALVISLLSAYAYLLGYMYELSTAEAFGIPREFVDVEIPNILLAGIAGVTALALVFSVIGILYESWKKRDQPIHGRIVLTVLTGIWFLLSLILCPSRLWTWLLPLIIFVLYGCWPWLAPLSIERNTTGYIAKLKTYDESYGERDKMVKDLVRSFGPRPFLLIGLAAFILHFTMLLGYARALNKKEFLVPSTAPNMVVLRINGDRLICAPFDRSTKEVEKKFLILKVGENPNMILHLEKVGPLRPKG
ncbi:MAG: hypothetical protein KAV00_13280 [Phycisphaerae bacterium]|nr:hypothetical protein [Phycisphaerae bacterium]